MHGANLPAVIRLDYPPIDTQKIVYLSEDNLPVKIIFSSSCKTILSFIGGSALACQRNTAIYRFSTKPISRQSMFSSFAYFVDKYLNRNGILTTFDIYTCRLVRRLPKGISAREVLMRNCYAITLRIFVLCLYSVVWQEQKSFGISFALVSAHRSTLCTDTKAKKVKS